MTKGPYSFTNPVKADKTEQYIVQRSDIGKSELFATADLKNFSQLTDVAAQQKMGNLVPALTIAW